MQTRQNKQTCFCGTNLTFEQCCQPLIHARKYAQTPEQLMRSRFSAYATNAYQYIFDTYAKPSQAELSVEDIQDSGKGSHWFALIIHSNTILHKDK
ncbi:MAG: YchJ family metal-binding protein, partial [Colwellia sp.]|nr:YchJ family metal-binding protein [Colwellia sp.]